MQTINDILHFEPKVTMTDCSTMFYVTDIYGQGYMINFTVDDINAVYRVLSY